jgi:hypothetical protein
MAVTVEVSTWTELFDLGFWETPPTRGRSPFSYNYMMNLIVSTYLIPLGVTGLSHLSLMMAMFLKLETAFTGGQEFLVRTVDL